MTDEAIKESEAQNTATPLDGSYQGYTGPPADAGTAGVGVEAEESADESTDTEGEETSAGEAIRGLLTGAAIGVTMFGVRAAMRRITRQPASSTWTGPSNPTYTPPAAPSAASQPSGGSLSSQNPEVYSKLVRGAFDTLRSGHQLRMNVLGKPPGPPMF